MKIEHIAMYVNDLEAARNFFVNYLGAVSNDGYHNQTTDFRSYFLTFDDGARLEIMHKPGTVSYTHLDVYKRQGIFMEKISGELSKRGITVPMAGIRASDDIAAVLDTFL